MRILFVCKSNVGRSQMAAAFFSGLKPKNEVKSAGTHVNEKEGQNLHEYVLQAMQEIGFDLSMKRRVQLTPTLVNESDKIIVMLDDHKDLPGYVPLNKVEFWDVPDAKDSSLEFHREVRDLIQKHVEELTQRKNEQKS